MAEQESTQGEVTPPSGGGDTLLSLASHELRTTLSIIKWYTEMLLDGDGGPLTDDQTKYLRTIGTSNQRAIDLIRSLLNVSRLDLGTFCINPAEVDLRVIVKQVLDDNEAILEKKKLHVEEKYGENEIGVPILHADKQVCLVIVRSLISNAILFSKEGGTIKIVMSNIEKDETFGNRGLSEDSLVLSISDSGIGIPEDDKKDIFSRLFKASNTKESDGTGAGLSLYIISLIFGKIGGAVWFDSVQDVGSTFYAAFPLSGMAKKEGTKSLD